MLEHAGVAEDSVGQAGSTGTSGCGSCLLNHSAWEIDCSVHLRLAWEKGVVALATLKQHDRAQQPAEEETKPWEGGGVSPGVSPVGVWCHSNHKSHAGHPRRQCLGRGSVPIAGWKIPWQPGRGPCLLVSLKHGVGGTSLRVVIHLQPKLQEKGENLKLCSVGRRTV